MGDAEEMPKNVLELVKDMEIYCLNPYCKKPISANDMKKVLPKKDYKRLIGERAKSVLIWEIFQFDQVSKVVHWFEKRYPDL